MTTPVRVLLVDDETELARSVADNIERYLVDRLNPPFDSAMVDVESNFESSLEHLTSSRFDLLILDILRESEGTSSPDDAGRDVFAAIRARQFLPVVFYAGDPRPVSDLINPPFVQSVDKGPNPEALLDAVAAAINSGLPLILRRVHQGVDAIVRDFVSTFVMNSWHRINGSVPDIAYLLARQLGTSFVTRADQIAEAIAESVGDSATTVSDATIHPHRFYAAQLHPGHSTGDIYRRSAPPSCVEDDTAADYFTLLTPTCDLVGAENQEGKPKAEFVLLGRCKLIGEFAEYSKWNASFANGAPSNTAKQRLIRLLSSRPEGGQADRYFFLPGAWHVPDLLVDLQEIVSLRLDSFLALDRVASLDSPFAEALSQQYVRFVGRIGVPDLDLDVTLDRMRRQVAGADEAD